MENYIKDYVIEAEGQTGLPFGDCCPQNVIHMKVKSGTKVKNIIDYSIRHFMDNPSERYIVVSGFADASNKAISCAEVLKQHFVHNFKQHLYQMTKIGYKSYEEFWKPKDDNLDVLKVLRKIPQIFILLSKDSLDLNESGVQYKNQNICNQLIDKKDSNINKSKTNNNKNKFKPKNRPKSSRKTGNESNETKVSDN